MAIAALCGSLGAAAVACGGGPKACHFRSISARERGAFGVGLDGSLWGWGDPGNGEMNPPHEVRYTDDIVYVATRNSGLLCETHQSGARLCWFVEIPGGVADLTAALDVAMSAGIWNCLLNADRTVGCWSDLDEMLPAAGGFTAPAGLGGDVVEVGLGGPNAELDGCAVKQDQSLWCWDAGILGDGAAARTTDTPAVEVTALRGQALAVAKGTNSSCVVETGGDVACWGDVVDTANPPLGPVPVTLDGRATAIAMGLGHACARTDDGQVWCWGANDDGQTGGALAADTAPQLVPVPGGNVVEVTAGDHTTCALTSDGSAYCWGANDSMQLGNAGVTATTAAAPVAVVGCP